ncbi:MAG: hypothetical protein SF028_02280 [Candidatus Sumerlaeia bacterium]|nr:hypothetical protein [Candidatus Sumerlaeia bacterium]
MHEGTTPMQKRHTQELVETALEAAVEALDLVATDDRLDARLREVQGLCNKALEELRGYPHEVPKEDWQK